MAGKRTKKREEKKISPVMEEALSDPKNLPRRLKKSSVLEGKIMRITAAEVWVDLGSKAEGVILGKELKDESDLLQTIKIGDSILVSVIQVENEHGQVVLSVKKAGMERKWRALEDKGEKREPVEVKVNEFNKGGLLVEYLGIRGFLPASQIASQRLVTTSGTTDIQATLAGLIGKKITVKVVELNRKENKLIFSKKAATGGPVFQYNEGLLDKIQKNDKVKGRVTRIVPFGILVDLGGIEGLVHISEVSWDRLKKPEDLVHVVEEIEVLVLDKDEKNRRIHLTIKRLLEDPWSQVSEKYKVGQEVSGFITRLTAFGDFVRLEEGIDGLIYSTQLAESGKEFKVGDRGNFRILSLDVSSKRMNLLPL